MLMMKMMMGMMMMVMKRRKNLGPEAGLECRWPSAPPPQSITLARVTLIHCLCLSPFPLSLGALEG